MSSVVLVTGAGRGIGLEFVRQYAAEGRTVLATVRDPDRAPALRAVAGAVSVLPLDVTDPAQVAALAASLDGRPIDLLINNAGVYGTASNQLGELDYLAWEQVLAVNTLGPVRVTEALLDCLRAGTGRKIVSVTSLMGSIGENTGGSLYYRSSKAALNAAMKTLAIDLGGEDFCVAVIHPGWVRTDMGGANAPLDAPGSVAAMRRVIDRLTTKETGGFFNYDGARLPW
jgi:NAD(P)-dependent dehydrogenase (short-subunit alcohol dehydrogenase family)